MKKQALYSVVLSLILILSYSQNQTSKWYFGGQAGLDFMTSPPTVLSGAMNTYEGCSSISDPAGNLLFYSNGINVWNNSHQVMANGNGLLGDGSSSQSGVIVKEPGSSTIYYIFSLDDLGGLNGLRYSVVDMSLAAGMGSVTTKNVLLRTPSTERITSARHCNGIDYWVISHDYDSGNFRANLITSAGINTVGILSTVGPVMASNNLVTIGCMKTSPNGRKLAICMSGPLNAIDLYDFDSSTGIISNPLTFTVTGGAYGLDFSPDGTKLYGGGWNMGPIWQWDLCAGSSTAIAASQTTIGICTLGKKGQFQLAKNGKIYIAKEAKPYLSVINSPNTAGLACNYVEIGQTLAPRTSNLGLPNFITNYFVQPLAAFTFSTGLINTCQTAAFAAPVNIQNNCAASGYVLTGVIWNFGDPASGSANTSTLTNPFHQFTAPGNYTTSLILYFSCGGGTDTLKQVVNINNPCPGLSVSSSSISCSTIGSATVTAIGGIGPFSYTWMPSGQTGVVATGLSPGSHTIIVNDLGNNLTFTATTVLNSLIPLTGNINSGSITCNGPSTGTASYSSISGGSGTQSYSWTNGTATYAIANPTNLSAGLWSVTVTDALTGCTLNDVFYITQPPALTLNLGSVSPSACVNSSIVLAGTTTGGTPFSFGPAYTYAWTNGPASATRTVTSIVSGAVVYTLVSSDSNGCSTSNTISVNFVQPTVSATGATVCNTQVINLNSSSGAAVGYEWQGPNGFVSYVQNPSIPNLTPGASGGYTVKVTAAIGCTNVAVASVTVTQMPLVNTISNSPKCVGETLSLFAITSAAGASYSWNGPNAFLSAQQNPFITNVNGAAAGIYNVAVILGPCLVNVATQPVIVNPLATGTITSNSPVCETKVLTFSVASAQAIISSTWAIPGGFPITGHSGQRDSSTLAFSGNYTVTFTDNNHCRSGITASLTILQNPGILAVGDTVCFQSPVKLKAIGGDSYKWYNATGNFSNLDEVTISSANYTSATVYTVVGKALNSCTSIATALVMTRPLPVPELIVSPSASICLGTGLSLKGYGANYYHWEGPGNILFSGQEVTFNVGNMAFGGTYTLTATDQEGCAGTKTTNITVYNAPTGSLRKNRETGCVPFVINFNFKPQVNASALKSNRWYMDGQHISDTSDFACGFKTTGDHLLTGYLLDANGCESTTTLVIKAHAPPNADFTFSPDKPVENLDEVLFVNNSKLADSYSWQFLSNELLTIDSKQANPSMMYETTGNYPVVLVASNKWKCADTVIKVIHIEPDFAAYVPNSFTPNDDNRNEVFKPILRGVKFFTFSIFDRWGHKLFETKSEGITWDGTNKGKACQNDIYVWKLLVSANNGAQKDLTGTVNLYR